MAVSTTEIGIWPGSSSFSAGQTPFGFYDSDTDFVSDADNFSDWAAKKLGYPIADVELQDVNFFTCLEEAVTEYGYQVNLQNIKDNMLNLIGSDKSVELRDKVVSSTIGHVIDLASDYGSEAGSGGTITYKTGSIAISQSLQTYDLNKLFRDSREPSESIEIKRIYHNATPGIVRYFDPYLDTGLGASNMLDQFGFGNFSPAVSFLMMPMFHDLLRLQAIEFNDQIRKSAYGFELINNQLKIFPIPTTNFKLHFDYIRRSDRNDPTRLNYTGSLISDSSNVPYSRMTYSSINSVGKRWIFRYGAALAKDMLGNVRSKYAQIPIPGAEVSLNGDTLLSQAQTEKEQLIEELRTDLEALSRRNQMEKNAEEAQFLQDQMNKIPLKVYIG